MRKWMTAGSFFAASVVALVLGVEVGQAQQGFAQTDAGTGGAVGQGGAGVGGQSGAAGAGIGGQAGAGGGAFNQGVGGQAGAGIAGQGGAAGAGVGNQAGIGNQAGAGGQAGPSATVPQYWIADASIFVANAYDTAGVMEKEGRFNVQAPGILTQQAQYVLNCAARALQDMGALQENSLATNPQALPAIRYIIGQLEAARAQAGMAAQTTSQGQLGPTYQVTVQSAMAHLGRALKALPAVGKAYGASQLAGFPPFSGQRAVAASRFSTQQFTGRRFTQGPSAQVQGPVMGTISGQFGTEPYSSAYRAPQGRQGQFGQRQGPSGQGQQGDGAGQQQGQSGQGDRGQNQAGFFD